MVKLMNRSNVFNLNYVLYVFIFVIFINSLFISGCTKNELNLPVNGNGSREDADKMAQGFDYNEMPPLIDQNIPLRLETATLALG